MTGLVSGDGDAEALVHPRDGDIHADAMGHVLGHPAVRGRRSLGVDGVELRAGHQRLRQPVADEQRFDCSVVLGLDRRVECVEFGGIRIDPVDRRLRGIADRADVSLGIGRACVAGGCGTAHVTAGHRADRRHRPGPRPASGGTGIRPVRRVLQHHALGSDTVIRVVAFGTGFPGVRACRDHKQSQRAGSREFQMRHLRSPSDGVCLHPTGDVVGCKGGNGFVEWFVQQRRVDYKPDLIDRTTRLIAASTASTQPSGNEIVSTSSYLSDIGVSVNISAKKLGTFAA